MLLRGGIVSHSFVTVVRHSESNWIFDFSDNEEKMTAGKEKERKTHRAARVHTSKLDSLPISRLHGFNHGDHFGLILFR